jgi:hypothetical protein
MPSIAYTSELPLHATSFLPSLFFNILTATVSGSDLRNIERDYTLYKQDAQP